MPKPLQPTRVLGTEVWAGSQAEAEKFLRRRGLVRTVICLRRDLPQWWALKKKHERKIRFWHLPVPSVFEIGMEKAVAQVIARIQGEAGAPALVFCLHGRNRTGVVAGVLRYTVTGSLRAAISEYHRRAGTRSRTEEEAVLRNLCRACGVKKPNKGKHESILDPLMEIPQTFGAAKESHGARVSS